MLLWLTLAVAQTCSLTTNNGGLIRGERTAHAGEFHEVCLIGTASMRPVQQRVFVDVADGSSGPARTDARGCTQVCLPPGEVTLTAAHSWNMCSRPTSVQRTVHVDPDQPRRWVLWIPPEVTAQQQLPSTATWTSSARQRLPGARCAHPSPPECAPSRRPGRSKLHWRRSKARSTRAAHGGSPTIRLRRWPRAGSTRLGSHSMQVRLG